MPKLEGNIGIIMFVVKDLRSIEMIKESHSVLTIGEEMTDYGVIEQCQEIIDLMCRIPKKVMLYGMQVHVLTVPTEK